MINIQYLPGTLSESEQSVVTTGFTKLSEEQHAPTYSETFIKWIGKDDEDELRAALTAKVLWDWLYLDELWVCPSNRGKGLGRALMHSAENHAATHSLQGIWLWTQSWQAADFYNHLGFEEFTRFPNFPKDHERIGLRKFLTNDPTQT